MIYASDIRNLRIYKKKFILPIDLNNKLKGSAAILLTPNYTSTINLINHKLIEPRYFKSYYIEKSIGGIVNPSGGINEEVEVGEPILESGYNKRDIYYTGTRYDINMIKRFINGNVFNTVTSRYKLKKDLDISVMIYNMHPKDIPRTTNTNINISSITNTGYSIDEYEDYCLAHIVRYVILNINPEISDRLVDGFCMYEAGHKLYYRSEHAHNIANILEYTENLYGITELINIVKYGYIEFDENDIPYLIKLGRKKLNMIKEENETSSSSSSTQNITSVNQIGRKIKRRVRKAIYKRNHIKKIIDINDPHTYNGITKPSDKSIETEKETNVEETTIAERLHFSSEEYVLEDGYIKMDNQVMLFEDSNDTYLKKILWKERLKTNKDVINIYDKIKEDTHIKYTYLDYKRYRSMNLYIDLSHYNTSFFKNNMYKLDRAVNIYLDFLNRIINDPRITQAGYNKKVVLIPVNDWDKNPDTKMWMYNEDINPISVLYRIIRKNLEKLKSTFKDMDFIFISEHAYFKVNFSEFEEKNTNKFLKLIKFLRNGCTGEIGDDIDNTQDNMSKTVIAMDIIDKIESSKGISITNISSVQNIESDDIKGKPDKKDNQKKSDDEDKSKVDKKKEELVNTVVHVAKYSESPDEALDNMDTASEERLKKLMMDLSSDEGTSNTVNDARASRIIKLQNDFLDKELHGKKIKDILDTNIEDAPIPKLSLDIDTVNDDIKNLTFINMNKNYDMDKDIVAMLNFLSSRSYPISVTNIECEDTSTSEDYIDTYSVKMEDYKGKRFTLTFDIPKFKDDKYMILRGNKKTISNQLLLMPISKTDNDTAQIVTNYKKIFIRRFGTTSGKSCVVADRIIKTLNKNTFPNIKLYYGNNSAASNKYRGLPIDYIDFATIYNKIEIIRDTDKITLHFNQDTIREICDIDNEEDLPFGIVESTTKNTKPEVMYYNKNLTTIFSQCIYNLLEEVDNFEEKYGKTNQSVRYTYSKASILTTEIPLVIVCCYMEGLTKTLKKSGIEFDISEKRPKYNKNTEDLITFKDGYLLYKLSYESSLLLNGLKACPTSEYSIYDLNNKSLYRDILELFGGKIKADGLDNFYDLLVDPITYEVLLHYNLPTDIVSMLLHANALLADNNYYSHTDSRTRRMRRNELIPAYFYQCLATSYGEYRNSNSHGRDTILTMKRSAVIDAIMKDPGMGDLSILNPLLEIEAYNLITYKGLSGLNSDRSYGLDKRGYDDTNRNIIALSTGFADTSGVTRQATIDANVESVRGYLKIDTDPEHMSTAKSFCYTEAITPFGSTRDDPFRSAMNFIQRNKHGVRIENGVPSLISNGADEALPYAISNTFAFKAKYDGKVALKTDDYMIVQYKNGESDYIDLSECTEKNSNGGIFVTVQKITKLKEGDKFKQNQILAYDDKAFSDIIGFENNISYSIGAFTKAAILSTDEGFEDSTIISKHLSESMGSTQVLCKSLNLKKDTGIYKLCKIGDKVNEGDPLLIMQNAFEEEDANKLMKTLIDDEDEISELGRVILKSPITGVVQNINILRTAEIEDLSPTLQKVVKDYEKNINKKSKVLEEYGITDKSVLPSAYKLDQVGKTKNIPDGVKIEIYVKYFDKLSIGDKLINFAANKGVVKNIFPEGKEPYSELRPNEKINILVGVSSLIRRMTTSIIINGVINKTLIELDRKNKDTLGIPYDINL